jgi:hypothetical protein
VARTPNEDRDAVLSERAVARMTKSEKDGLRWLVGLLAAEVEPALARSVNEGVILRKLLNRELAAKGWPGAAQAPPRPYPPIPEPQVLRVAEPTDPNYAASRDPSPGERVVELDGEATAPAPAGKAKRSRR